MKNHYSQMMADQRNPDHSAHEQKHRQLQFLGNVAGVDSQRYKTGNWSVLSEASKNVCSNSCYNSKHFDNLIQQTAQGGELSFVTLAACAKLCHKFVHFQDLDLFTVMKIFPYILASYLEGLLRSPQNYWKFCMFMCINKQQVMHCQSFSPVK